MGTKFEEGTPRFMRSQFSFGGDAPDSAYAKGHEAIFEQKPSPFCAECGLRFAWCECPPMHDCPGCAATEEHE